MVHNYRTLLYARKSPSQHMEGVRKDNVLFPPCISLWIIPALGMPSISSVTGWGGFEFGFLFLGGQLIAITILITSSLTWLVSGDKGMNIIICSRHKKKVHNNLFGKVSVSVFFSNCAWSKNLFSVPLCMPISVRYNGATCRLDYYFSSHSR